MKPILSRFCEIYVPEPILNGSIINLYQYNLNEVFLMKDIHNHHLEWLKKELNKYCQKKIKLEKLTSLSTKLYEKLYIKLDIIYLLCVMIVFLGLANIFKNMNLMIFFTIVIVIYLFIKIKLLKY